jgi:hypothetical protein
LESLVDGDIFKKQFITIGSYWKKVCNSYWKNVKAFRRQQQFEDGDSYWKNTKTMERRQQLLEERYNYWKKANSY